ncbi:MAG: hypothetical protein F9B45_22165 [Phycisphaera sp. RhM]|nr:hypothetical protein [Phycisphaera sp. RhM]
MVVSRYALYRNSQGQSTQKNSVEYLDIAILTHAKRNEGNKFFIANELLACRLGEALGVPVALGTPVVAPVFFENRKVAEREYWGSLSVRESPPPADCQLFVQNSPDIATGVVVFDAWICNIDRHELNLHYDIMSGEVFLFDHGEAICNCVGPEFLETKRDTLGFENGHVIAFELTSFDFLEKWLARLGAIDIQFIRTTVDILDMLSSTEKRKLVLELDRRKRCLEGLFHKSLADKAIFASIEPSLLNSEDTNDPIDFTI